MTPCAIHEVVWTVVWSFVRRAISYIVRTVVSYVVCRAASYIVPLTIRSGARRLTAGVMEEPALHANRLGVRQVAEDVLPSVVWQAARPGVSGAAAYM